MNHYEALGVPQGSTSDEIRRAYLAAARRFHPDFHGDADEATRLHHAGRMQELNQAWSVLGDPAARARYDHGLLTASDPGVARRAAREPGSAQEPAMPDGKGWTPRADDDGWMTDFEGWANESDALAPDAPRSTRRHLVTLAPLALFATGIVVGFVGVAIGARTLLALAAVCVIVSAGLFVLVPMLEMTRRRR